MSRTRVILDHDEIVKASNRRAHWDSAYLPEPAHPDRQQSARWHEGETAGRGGGAGLLLVLMLMAGLFVALAVTMR